jgi:hypothetical protein
MYWLVLGEPGVFIGKINHNDPTRAFLGYVNEKESQKKIVHDVFSKGDAAFISGNVFYEHLYDHKSLFHSENSQNENTFNSLCNSDNDCVPRAVKWIRMMTR